MTDEADSTQGGLVERILTFTGALLRTAGLTIFWPYGAARRLLADHAADGRRYCPPPTYLLSGSLVWGFVLSGPLLDRFEKKDWASRATGLLEDSLEAFALDDVALGPIAVSFAFGLTAVGVASLARRVLPREVSADAHTLLLYGLGSLPPSLFLFLVAAVIPLGSEEGPYDFFVFTVALLYFLVLSPLLLTLPVCAVLFSKATDYSKRRPVAGIALHIAVLGSCLAVPATGLAAFFLSQPVHDSFERYATSKLWIAAAEAPVWDPNTMRLILSLSGQLDASEPRELDPPKLCPPIRTGYWDCLEGEFDRRWVPFGEGFDLTLTLSEVSEEFQNVLGDMKLCRRWADNACFRGFEWPINLHISARLQDWPDPRSAEPPIWDERTQEVRLPVTVSLRAPTSWKQGEMWLCPPDEDEARILREHEDSEPCLRAKLDPEVVSGNAREKFFDSTLSVKPSGPEINLAGWLFCARSATHRACLDFRWPDVPISPGPEESSQLTPPRSE